MSKVLDDAKATADAANALVTEIETSEAEGSVTPVDKTVTSVVVNYSDGSSDTLSPSPLDNPATAFPGMQDTAPSDTGSDTVSDTADNTPADSTSGEPAPAPEPVAAGTIPS